MKIQKCILSTVLVLSGLAVITQAEGKGWDPTRAQGWQLQDSEAARHTKKRVSSHRPKRIEGTSDRSSVSFTVNAGIGPRPGQWCGWWMRTQKGGGPEFNIAWNWRNYGAPTSPQVGAVVVWKHHVGILVGQTASGVWLVKSGNDGGAVRTRARSIQGAVFRI